MFPRSHNSSTLALLYLLVVLANDHFFFLRTYFVGLRFNFPPCVLGFTFFGISTPQLAPIDQSYNQFDQDDARFLRIG